jgi:hypothetical protein
MSIISNNPWFTFTCETRDRVNILNIVEQELWKKLSIGDQNCKTAELQNYFIFVYVYVLINLSSLYCFSTYISGDKNSPSTLITALSG